jgi:hypothetical protein
MTAHGQPPEIEQKATELIEAGFVFEVEELTTGIVSMDCNRGEIVLAHELSENGPAIVDAVRILVENAYNTWKQLQ